MILIFVSETCTDNVGFTLADCASQMPAGPWHTRRIEVQTLTSIVHTLSNVYVAVSGRLMIGYVPNIDSLASGDIDIAKDQHFLFGVISEWQDKYITGVIHGPSGSGIFVAAKYIENYEEKILNNDQTKASFTVSEKTVVFFLRFSDGKEKRFLVDDISNQ